MADVKTAIKGLEEVSDYFFDIYRNETDSYKYEKALIYSDAAIDAIALLKEYEDVLEGIKEQPTIHEKAIEPKLSEHKIFGTNRVCGACGKYIFPAAKYCNECGRAVKWDEVEEERPKVLRFSDMSFSMPIEDGETPEDIEDRVIEVMDALRDNMVISYKTNIEELDDDDGINITMSIKER